MKFSIGIPVTNYVFLKDAIDSCQKQTYNDIEAIILNNALNKDIKTKIKDIVTQYNDPRIIYHENDLQLPLIENWNKCLSYARGEYFCLLSDDDYYEEEYIAEFNSIIDQFPEVSVFHCRVREIDENKQTIGFTPSCPRYEDVINYLWHRISEFRKQYISDFVFKTSSLKNIKGFYNVHKVGWGTDDITSSILCDDGGIVFVDKILINYRIHSQNITFSSSIIKRLDAVDNHKKWLISFLNTKRKGSLSDVQKELLEDLQKRIDPYFENRKYSLLLIGNFKLYELVRLCPLLIKKNVKLKYVLKIIFKSILKTVLIGRDK
jgi:glycosyltransferase involved in cell wall biosynthesis